SAIAPREEPGGARRRGPEACARRIDRRLGLRPGVLLLPEGRLGRLVESVRPATEQADGLRETSASIAQPCGERRHRLVEVAAARARALERLRARRDAEIRPPHLETHAPRPQALATQSSPDLTGEPEQLAADGRVVEDIGH